MNPLKIKTFGNSMFPFFINGDILHLAKISFKKIQVDDFITFKSKGGFITHRVIYKDPKDTFLITKGDKNRYHDGRVYPKQIIGKVDSVKRGKTQLATFDLYFFQSTHYFREIIKITAALYKNQINFVILKGLPLHLYFEKKFPSRIYADCDILIDKKQFGKVSNIFHKLGYKQFDETLDSTFKKLKDKDTEIQFKKNINGIPVTFDIHLEAVFLMTQLGRLEALYPQKLLDNFTTLLLLSKKKIHLNNSNFPILNNELLVIYLALHLFHHNFQGYYRYELIKKIMLGKKLDYAKIASIIRIYKLQKFILPVFLLLKKYYSITLPSSIKNIQKELTSRYYQDKLSFEDIFNDEMRVNSGIKRFRNIFSLSSEPLHKKIFVFLNLQVIYAFYFSIFKKINLIYLRYNFLLKQQFRKLF